MALIVIKIGLSMTTPPSTGRRMAVVCATCTKAWLMSSSPSPHRTGAGVRRGGGITGRPSPLLMECHRTTRPIICSSSALADETLGATLRWAITEILERTRKPQHVTFLADRPIGLRERDVLIRPEGTVAKQNHIPRRSILSVISRHGFAHSHNANCVFSGQNN